MPMPPTRRHKRASTDKTPTTSMADVFKARQGYRKTAENRRCVHCFEMLPDAAFDVLFTPAEPLINICRGCKSRPQASSLAEAFGRPHCQMRDIRPVSVFEGEQR
jgi:hypothetical protein